MRHATCRRCGVEFPDVRSGGFPRRYCSHECAVAARTIRGPYVRKSLESRLWPKVRRGSPEECWEWQGAKDQRGYGRIGTGGKHGRALQAYRAVYELLVGPVPEGLELDHLCRNTACVNPSHLEPVTHAENIRRMYAAREA